MALVLVVETGSGLTTANSYATVAEADAYHLSHLYAGPWDRAEIAGTPPDVTKKTQALVWATRLLDENARWQGLRSTTTQALEWPRTGVWIRSHDDILTDDAIPAWLKNATAELARLLIEKDRTAAAELQRETSRTVAGKSTTQGPKDRAYRGVLPPSVWSQIAPYVQTDSDLVRA